MPASLNKSYNAVLQGVSFLKSSLSRNAVIYGMPLSIGAELTNNCNLKCPECLSGSGKMKREQGYMSLDLYNKVISELRPYIYNVNLFFQGEPMLHPSFFSFVHQSKNIHTVLSTNGHFLSGENSASIARSGLNKIIISLDGMDQETYAAYRRNGNINTVLAGIKDISNAKKAYNSSLKIEIQFLVSKLNEKQIPQVRLLAKEMGCSLRLKSMQVISREDISSWLPTEERFRRYEYSRGEFKIKSRLPRRCARLWFNPVITWDGKVVPCCFDKDADHIMGDLNHDSFRDIWNGQAYTDFRRNLLEDRRSIDICRNCSSGLRGVR